MTTIHDVIIVGNLKPIGWIGAWTVISRMDHHKAIYWLNEKLMSKTIWDMKGQSMLIGRRSYLEYKRGSWIWIHKRYLECA